MEFNNFKKAVQKKLEELTSKGYTLYVTDVERQSIWDKYLASFPEGTDEMFRERTSHDCVACKQFLRPYGNIVAIVDNNLVSIWDIDVEGYYQDVADGLSEMVKSAPIKNVFVSKIADLGKDKNVEMLLDGTSVTWEHFFYKLPAAYVDKTLSSEEAIQAKKRDAKEVFKRGLDEISIESAKIVLELIKQKSVYRGDEFEGVVNAFILLKGLYIKVPENQKDNYCWRESVRAGGVTKIRNTAIGTLLTDISDGRDLDAAVHSFGSKMDGYKRPKNLILSKKQIQDAQNKIIELGFEDSLGRRYAQIDDVTINNVLFANRDAKEAMNVFEELEQEIVATKKQLSKIEEISVKDFIKNVLPKATSLELLLDNKHDSNFMSLIAPKVAKSKTMFKWGNNFSQTYNGDVADSIRQRVKDAGGNVNGVIRASLSWYNYDDLDLHVIEPNNNHIYHGNAKQKHPSTGILDVDMNVGANTRKAVENIVWTNKSKMIEGVYTVYVKNYTKRENIDVGFEVELEYDGKIHTFKWDKSVAEKENVTVVKFEFTRAGGMKILSSIAESSAEKEVWGLKTNTFHKVSLMANSPNYWDEKGVGNKHYLFILNGCKNPNTPRGFFNEYLSEELMEHKRVFEVLGNKMKVEPSDKQLSGLGFSTTQKNSVICKVEGNFNRTLKIMFN